MKARLDAGLFFNAATQGSPTTGLEIPDP
jgi:hypothetical protein